MVLLVSRRINLLKCSSKDGTKSEAKQSSPATRHGGTCEEKRYSSYSFLASALDEGEWSVSRPQSLKLIINVENDGENLK
jgi:hypothetical protein